MGSRYIIVATFWFVTVTYQQASFSGQNAQQAPEVHHQNVAQQQQYQQNPQQQQQYQQPQQQQQQYQGGQQQQQQYQQPQQQQQQYQQPQQQQQQYQQQPQHQQPPPPQQGQQQQQVQQNPGQHQVHSSGTQEFGGEQVKNVEHIKEHLDGKVDPTANMTPEQLQFHYFNMHDLDKNGKLDGTELIKAITHFHAENMSPEYKGSNTPPPLPGEIELEQMIDAILKEDDFNVDGYIDYGEFVKAQKQREEQIRSSQQHQPQQQQQQQQQQQH